MLFLHVPEDTKILTFPKACDEGAWRIIAACFGCLSVFSSAAYVQK